MHIQKRGGKFWLWADCLLETVGYQAHGQKGSSVDVQARTNREGCTQMFIGVYDAAGNAVCEEFYSRLSGDTVEEALNWGIRRCDELVDQAAPFTSPHRVCAKVTQASQLSGSPVEPESNPRESYLLASRNALAQYVQANVAWVSIMSDRTSDSQTRREHARSLNAALDAWESLPRQYVNSTRDALNKKTPKGASSFGDDLLIEELEYDGLGVGLTRV